MKQDIAHDAAKFGEKCNPPLNEKRAALAGLDQSIAAEDARIAARAQMIIQVAVNAERILIFLRCSTEGRSAE